MTVQIPNAERAAPRPFTVIGGFLGAGKTTMVNHVLAQASGTRYAVLVNDFGAVNVDEGLIARHDGRTMALTNGCICCSMADGFIQTMLTLMADPDAFDHVIVEASGVAEPDRIMDFARLDPLLSADAIITLVDAEGVSDRLADPRIRDVVQSQIAAADLLVLNKTDLVDSGRIHGLQSILSDLNSAAPIVQSQASQVPLAVLLGPKATSDSRRKMTEKNNILPFSTFLIQEKAPIARADFDHWQEMLGPDVLRGKGRVRLEDGSYLWQRVGTRATLSPVSEDGETEIVLISLSPDQVPWPAPAR